MEQPQYNIFERQKVEADYLPLYDLIGLGTTIWSPLASGVLTGKYNDGVPADSRMNLPGYEWLKEKWSTDAGRAQLEQVRQLAKLSNEIGLSITHLALLWCLANKHVSTVILGASRASQLQDNLAALSHKDKVTSDVLERIDSIVGNKPEAPRRF
jgi:aryl-alcohol dehydrogenase-like predicted oxidoreductase